MGESKMGLQARPDVSGVAEANGYDQQNGLRLYLINQLREKIGIMFGNPETTTGGNALKFYASVRLDIRRIGQIKKPRTTLPANRVKVKVVKNKVAPPLRLSNLTIMYGRGISKSGEIIDLGVELNVIQKSGSWFSYSGNKLGQGRDAVKQLIEDTPELMDELERKIKEKISAEDPKAVLEEKV
jgi:recombination protein RecA